MMRANDLISWLATFNQTRDINIIQNHHTYIPNYSHFKGNNHIQLCHSMEKYAINERGFDCIPQNITVFPDGNIVICRDLNKVPAGIKGANTKGICIENLGNFDIGGDIMTDNQREAIVMVNAVLVKHFNIKCDTNNIVYHHWYDIVSGDRKNGSGVTKSCPGTGFFGGNGISNAANTFIPLIKKQVDLLFNV